VWGIKGEIVWEREWGGNRINQGDTDGAVVVNAKSEIQVHWKESQRKNECIELRNRCCDLKKQAGGIT
jgi:hypothetical protein